jgi:hypothetical protein
MHVAIIFPEFVMRHESSDEKYCTNQTPDKEKNCYFIVSKELGN